MNNTSNGERFESALLVLILAVVAIAAGWASFTHVHDWTMRHVPAGTPSAFGWVNAVISELVPVAAFLTIRRRQRTGAPIGYPVVLLLASAALSLAAQLAVASPSPSGWLLSAVPALAFMALVKLVFATPADNLPSPVEPAPLPVDTEPPAEPEPPAPRVRTVAAVVPVPAGAFTRLQSSEVNHR
ncbi:hypothetical protein AB0C29_03875 [Actinoplanes sp. NPDC048791]|uniref:hypothetical protein n=1 Tax=Actinoplanes sp. NPDC048791 TaxID=3154623 RepID=UPI0033ED83AE